MIARGFLFVASGVLVVGVLLIFAFIKARDYLLTAEELRAVNNVLEPHEVPVLIGKGKEVTGGLLYVLCVNGEPQRLLASWVTPMREFHGRPEVGRETGYEIDGHIHTMHRDPLRFDGLDIPNLKIIVGERRDLYVSQRLTGDFLSNLSSMFVLGTGWTYSFSSGEAALFFSLVGGANEGLNAVCGNAA